MTVVIVQCGSQKLKHPARADELYTGRLFKAGRRAARRLAGSRWFVLSAKHGLVNPSTILVPYDATIPKGGDPEWGSRVLEKLKQVVDADERVIALAAADYCVGWAEEIGAELPLRGIGGSPSEMVNFRVKAMKELK